MRGVPRQRGDVAAAHQPPQLHLRRRPADLRHHRSRHHRHQSGLQPRPVIRPHLPHVPVRGHKHARVINGRPHADRRSASSPLTRRRAAAISAAVSGPCSASHSATATSPSRTSSTRRAASVIHADTLTPSAAAAATTRACTSGSTVMASFGDGFPRGMSQLYHHSRIIAYLG